MKTIRDIDISGKRVFIRVDFNVPLDRQQRITDDSRIRAALPTIVYAREKRAKLILASHLGRPKGKPVQEFSLSPVAERLGDLLDTNVRMAKDCVGEAVAPLIAGMEPGDVVLLENLRFHAEEQENDDDFAHSLAAMCDVYINDAFAVSHRANASVVAITKFAPISGAGLLLKKEIDYISKAMADPRRPMAAIVGGVKVSSKLAALHNMLQHVDTVIVGGAMANTFLKSMGYAVGKSRVEEDRVAAAGEVMKMAAEKGVRFYLPVDVVVAPEPEAETPAKIVTAQEIPRDWMALDIGPATALLFREALQDVRTVVWNGPMGMFEIDAFSRGTTSMAAGVAAAHALTIVGGGDTVAAVNMAGETDRVAFISTGGGAFLEMLEGKTLPAVAALETSAEPAP
ncbi:MAG: phosphoglycerate kinase [Deltaproteobacteria bacterium]|nr:phosphoglycerate kinase [Deltaproteobacteria bacterium]